MDITADPESSLILGTAHILNRRLDYLNLYLMMIKGVLRDIDAAQLKEERVLYLAREIKNLIYKIEDTTDTFRIYIHERSVKRFFKKITFSKYMKGSLREAIEVEIQDIRNSFDDLVDSHKIYGITPADYSSSSIDDYEETLPNHYVEGQRLLVGVDEDMQLLLSSMFDESKNYQVIVVCGMVGIGKTNLAMHLFNHNSILENFEAIAFVHIPPQQFSFRIVFESILHQFLKNQPEQRKAIRDMEENELVNHLHNFQQNHRCIIFLDNIPSRDAWERLQIAFPLQKTANKLLITTRSLEVAVLSTAQKGIIHTMRCLTETDGWKLFNQYITLNDDPEFRAVHPEMENISRNLVGQCNGLPLGIVAVGAMFTTKSTLQRRRIALNNTKVFEEVLPALTSIYSELPCRLKSCLLYLATFRKDMKLRTEKLYHMWMAEGFISRNDYQSETKMSMAESHLNDLRLKHLVYVHEEDVPTARKFKSCSLHDLIHDFCLFMGRQEEFFVLMKNEVEQEYNASSSTDRKQRVVFYLGKHTNIKALVRLTKNLRCLLVHNAYTNQVSETHEMLSDLLTCIIKSGFLRILDFDSINFGSTKLPKGISNLVLLRYLSFKGCLLKSLPESIGNLPCLMILDLRVMAGCQIEIPNVFQNMKKLRHLYLPVLFRTCFDGKLRLNGLTQLETLENFNMELCDVEDLFGLTKLRYLTLNIGGRSENFEKLINYMRVTSDSEHVSLHSTVYVKNFDCYAEETHSIFRQLLAWRALHVLYMEGHLSQIPPYGKISKNLTKIVLSGSELQYDPMPTLEKLPKLRVLILYDGAFLGKEVICTALKFPELRRVELSNLSDLESWTVEEGAMPKLSTLVIENCSQLKMLPDGVRFLKNLQKLKVLKMPKTFELRLREINGIRGPDMDKVPRNTSVRFAKNES